MSPISINRVVLTGYLTSDPVLRALPSGLSVCDLRIAVSARRRDPVTGEWGERPNYFDVVVFAAHGETVAKYMQKGRRIAIDGRLHWREWETKDGRQAQAVKVIAETVQFMGSPPGESYGADGNGQEAPEGITVGEEESLNSADGEELQRMDEEALATGLESADEDPQTMDEEALATGLESADEDPQTMDEEAPATGLESADEDPQTMDEEAPATGLESADEDPQTMDEEAPATGLESAGEDPQTMEEQALATGPLVDYREQ